VRHVTLKLVGERWCAQFHNAPEVVQAFGSELIPTPYLKEDDPEWVLVETLIILSDYQITLERPDSTKDQAQET
jgi:hypothetical protein